MVVKVSGINIAETKALINLLMFTFMTRKRKKGLLPVPEGP